MRCVACGRNSKELSLCGPREQRREREDERRGGRRRARGMVTLTKATAVKIERSGWSYWIGEVLCMSTNIT